MKIADPIIHSAMHETAQPGAFSFVAGSLALDYTNTISSFMTRGDERLMDYSQLVRWGLDAGVLTDTDAESLLEQAAKRPGEASMTLDQALALRESLHWIFSATASGQGPKENDVLTLNRALSHALSHSIITKVGSGFAWDWSKGPKELDRMLWPVARSAAELLTSDHLDRVRQCAGDDCTWLFLDMSRNHSRQWCDMGDCGNRAKARRYYQRRKKVS